MKWTQDRVRELFDLQVLLNEVKAINSGSNALQRIAKCIDLAERLTEFNFDRDNFMRFLDKAVSDAIKEQTGTDGR